MKVIENNYNTNNINRTEEERIICENCNSIFTVEQEDCQIGEQGCAYVNCPCCGWENIIDKYSIQLNANNLSFPIHYTHFSSKNKNTVYIEDEKINKWIKETLDWFKIHSDQPFRYMATGDTYIVIFNHKDEYWILVTKDYYEVGLDK